MEVPIKTIQLPPQVKRGRSTVAVQDKAPSKRRRKVPAKQDQTSSKGQGKKRASKSVNVDQPLVDGHQKGNTNPVDVHHAQPSTQVRTSLEAGTSETPITPVLGNHEELQGVKEISIHYASSRESYDLRSSTHISHVRLRQR